MIIPPYPPTPRFQWSLGVILRPVNYDPLLLFPCPFCSFNVGMVCNMKLNAYLCNRICETAHVLTPEGMSVAFSL